MFSRMKVGARLATLVAVLLAALVAVGFLGVRNMSATIDNLRTMYEQHTTVINLTADVRFRRVINVGEALRAFQHNPAQELAKLHDHPTSEHVDRIEATALELRELLKKLNGMAQAGDEQRLIQALNENLQRYQQEVLAPTVQAIKAGNFATTVMGDFLKKNRTIGKDFDDSIAALMAFERSAAKLAYESAVARDESMRIFTLGTILLASLLGGWFAIVVVRSVTRPLSTLRDGLDAVAQKSDFTHRVQIDSNDEVGETAQAFNTLMETQQKAISEVNGVVKAIANGDFSRRVEADLPGDLKTMKDAVNGSARSVKTTMTALGEVMDALAAGDFSRRMNPEVKGEVRQAVDGAMQSMQSILGDAGRVLSAVAAGNLSERMHVEASGELASLKENMNAALGQLSRSLQAVTSNTQQVAAASNQTSSAIGQISDGAQNQMHAINQVASAVQQTAASVTDVAKAAESANSRAQSMGLTVNESMADMNRMVDIVQTIAANADRIDKITDVIEKIANKTNLLSLNAAIEAARAGEHGKGFAVVAEEVGKLAASAAESTQEITALVKQAVEDADRASETVTVVNKGMQGIAHGARQTEAELQRISAAMEQQNAAITEINANVGSLNKIASANASAAEEITATVMELARLADGTRREVARFAT